jgi:hypothetical protein
MRKNMELLHDIKNIPHGELQFLETCSQIVIRCRQILKWVYAFHYFVETDWGKKELELFLFSKTRLEEACEETHNALESPLDKFLSPEMVNLSAFYTHKNNIISKMETLEKRYEGFLEFIAN